MNFKKNIFAPILFFIVITLSSCSSQTIDIEGETKFSSILDEDSLKRLDTNPLRILDSKNEETQKVIKNAPKISSFFSQKSTANYEGSDSFTYKVTDGTVDSNVATVSITNEGVFEKSSDSSQGFSSRAGLLPSFTIFTTIKPFSFPSSI